MAQVRWFSGSPGWALMTCLTWLLIDSTGLVVRSKMVCSLVVRKVKS